MAHIKGDPGVDAFFDKDFPWKAELQVLRALCREAGLEEALKWKQPCYCVDGRNVVVLQAFKHCCALGFFKGVLYRDPGKVLEVPTENSQSARRMSFVNVADIQKRREDIVAMLAEGKRVETAGERVEFKETGAFEMPAELEEALARDTAFAEAFRALTPGRQRGYILHFSGAKQSTTRASRIERHWARILAGKGLQDR